MSWCFVFCLCQPRLRQEPHGNLHLHLFAVLHRVEQVKDHPNIVHILGLCDCDIVTEYFPLYMDEILLNDAPRDPIPEDKIIRMALDAARGLRALHEVPGGPVVHADLQPRQLLMDEDGTVKLNDLNRCRFMARDSEGKPCPFKISKGNGVWRSPEEYAWEVSEAPKAESQCHAYVVTCRSTERAASGDHEWASDMNPGLSFRLRYVHIAR